MPSKPLKAFIFKHLQSVVKSVLNGNSEAPQNYTDAENAISV